jgi:hypothetical protein
MKKICAILFLVLLPCAAAAQDSTTRAKSLFASATDPKPGTCRVGDVWVDTSTNPAVDKRCLTAGTWTASGGVSGSGTSGRLALWGASGLTNNANLTYTSNGSVNIAGTVTTNDPALNITRTWNNSGVTFTGIKANFTDSASGGGSLLMDLQVGGVSQFSLFKAGLLSITGEMRSNTSRVAASGYFYFVGKSTLFSPVDGVFQLANAAQTGGSTVSAIPTSPAQITADQNNYNPGASSLNLRLSSDASRTLTGLTFTNAKQDGQIHYIWNVGSQNIVLANESASSTAANRFTTTTGADLTLGANKCAFAFYDATSARWRVTLLP